jgi:hypothetical protein
MTTEVLLGPLAGLAICLLILVLFYTGKILPRNTVPREDYEEQKAIIASYSEAVKLQTQSLNELVTVVRHLQRNGSVDS